MSKSGQKFAIITVEDFTGSTEALLWGKSYTDAAEQEGLLVEGNFIQFRARISEDEKTGGKKVSANGVEQIGSSSRRRGGKSKCYEITLNTARHNAGDLELIKSILQKYPGEMPVHMTFRNSLGNRLSIELGSRYCVAPCPALDEELSLYS
jgi:DNA polymerase-3 subunit alpha